MAPQRMGGLVGPSRSTATEVAVSTRRATGSANVGSEDSAFATTSSVSSSSSDVDTEGGLGDNPPSAALRADVPSAELLRDPALELSAPADELSEAARGDEPRRAGGCDTATGRDPVTGDTAAGDTAAGDTAARGLDGLTERPERSAGE